MTIQVDVRPLVATDKPFVLATWKRQLATCSPLGRALGTQTTMALGNRVVDGLLGRPTSRVLVATPRGGEEIVGWLSSDTLAGRPLIHFAFVKNFARHSGVLSALLEAGAIDPNESLWSHPNDSEDWVRAKWPGLEVLDVLR